MSAHGGRRAIIAAFFANLGIMIAKIVGFAFTGAASMLAEAVHSFADASNQGLLILGDKLAKRKETPEHPFGFGRERYFWAFIVAMIIFTLGSLFAIYEGIDKLLHPHDIESPEWAIGILIFALVVEAFSLKVAVVESRRAKGDQSWWSFIKDAKVPELPVVLLEDIGAMAGLVLALVGVGLAMFTGDARFDAMGSLAIGILLGIIAMVLGIEMRSLLLGESASDEVIEIISNTIREQDEVEHLIHMRTQHIGPEELLVAAKVEFDNSLTSDDIASVINKLEDKIRERVPIAKMIYIEPDVMKKEKQKT